jgi:hypothetical protein
MTRTPREALAKFWRMPKMTPLNAREREWVYFLEADCQPALVKIGKTSDLKWRVLTIQHMSPVTLTLIGAISGPIGTESVMHRKCADVRQHGEWFLLDAALREFIAALPKGGPLPPELINQWAAEYQIDLDAQKLKGLMRKKQRRKSIFGQWEIPIRLRKY